MARATSSIPGPINSDERPFEVGDTLTIFEAAMVYAGRHPHSVFLRDGSVEDHVTFLRAGIREREPRSRDEIGARQSWDIYCEIMKRIRQGDITAVKRAYSKDGEIDPIQTVIRTADLVALASERDERPKYLKHIYDADAQSSAVSQRRPLTEKNAREFTVKYIADKRAAGRRPTQAGLEDAAREANMRGSRQHLRDAFRNQLGAPVKRGRPHNSPQKFAKK